MPLQTGLAGWLRDAGLEVVEVDGWKQRGNPSFNPGGVVCHHTAGGPSGDIPSLRVLIEGRSDLPGPLCQIGLARSGICYVVAAGRANHAGSGSWKGMVGTSSVWGIEAENRGTQAAEPWKAEQLEAYRILAAVLQEHSAHATDAAYVCGHKEWAPSRKVDPHTLSMQEFRAIVARIMAGEEDDLPYTEEQLKKIVRAVLDEDVTKETIPIRGLRGVLHLIYRAAYKVTPTVPNWPYAQHLDVVTAQQERDRALLVKVAKKVGLTDAEIGA
jgi:hypothetical protein